MTYLPQRSDNEGEGDIRKMWIERMLTCRGICHHFLLYARLPRVARRGESALIARL